MHPCIAPVSGLFHASKSACQGAFSPLLLCAWIPECAGDLEKPTQLSPPLRRKRTSQTLFSIFSKPPNTRWYRTMWGAKSGVDIPRGKVLSESG